MRITLGAPSFETSKIALRIAQTNQKRLSDGVAPLLHNKKAREVEKLLRLPLQVVGSDYCDDDENNHQYGVPWIDACQ